MSYVIAVKSDRSITVPQLLAVQNDNLTPLTITADADTVALFGTGPLLWVDFMKADGTDVFIGPYALALSISASIPASVLSVAGALTMQVRIEDDDGKKWQTLRVKTTLPVAIDSETPAGPDARIWVEVPADYVAENFFSYDPTTGRLIDIGRSVAEIDAALGIIEGAEDATVAANAAAETATTAAGNADTKASLADSKATLADQKATLADQKATLANDAAAAATSAAGTATSAAGSATSAAGSANTAADNANAFVTTHGNLEAYTGQAAVVGNRRTYLGSLYECILDATGAILPTNATYYKLVASKGDAGGDITNAASLPYTDTGNKLGGATQVQAALDSAGAQLAQIDSRLDFIEAETAVFGVRFTNASSSPAGTRIYDSVGLTAVAGVGEPGNSGFDAFDIFQLRRCNRVGGVVTAYYGEPGYSNTLYDVFVEIPKGYYRVWNDGTYTNYAISKRPFYGSAVHPAFKHNASEQNFVYIAAYKSSYDGASKHESKSGALPDVSISRTTSRTRSRARGTYASMQDIQIRDWLNLLFMVEFATRDSQTALGRGYCDMPYSATHVSILAETGVNRVVLANAFADLFVVGQEISLSTALGSSGVAADRTITSIDVYDASNKAITFTGSVVTTLVGTVVWTSRQKNGKCDAIGQGSGRAIGTNGKTSVLYRGIENPFGNVWEWVDNLNVRNNQEYSLVSGALAGYNDTDFGTAYTALSAAFPATSNYMVTPLIDPVTGLSCLPASVGGASSQYFCDYYYQNTGDRASLVGGVWSNGSNSGLWSWYLYYSASVADISVGSRLLEIPA